MGLNSDDKKDGLADDVDLDDVDVDFDGVDDDFDGDDSDACDFDDEMDSFVTDFEKSLVSGANEDPDLNKELIRQVMELRAYINYDDFLSAYHLVGEGLGGYHDAASKVKLLSREQENDLMGIFASGGVAVRRLVVDTFIIANQKWVLRVALKFSNKTKLPLEDCLNNGNLGFYKAVPRFDPSRGYKFLTYAALCIRQSMRRAAMEDSGFCRFPVYIHEIVPSFKRARDHFIGHGIPYDDDDLADYILENRIRSGFEEAGIEFTDDDVRNKMEELSLERAKILRTIKKIPANSVSLDARCRDADTESKFGDVISYDNLNEGKVPSISRVQDFRDVESNFCDLFVRASVNQISSAVHRVVLALRHGLYVDPLTLESVGKILGVTRERVRQIEVDANDILRVAIENGELTDVDAASRIGELTDADAARRIGMDEERYLSFNDKADNLYERISGVMSLPSSYATCNLIIKRFGRHRIKVALLNMLFIEQFHPLDVARVCALPFEEVFVFAKEIIDEISKVKKSGNAKKSGKKPATPEVSLLSPEDQPRS